jgi:hypothetical protein
VPLANPYRRYAALTEVFKKHVARAPGTPIASVGTLHAATDMRRRRRQEA